MDATPANDAGDSALLLLVQTFTYNESAIVPSLRRWRDDADRYLFSTFLAYASGVARAGGDATEVAWAELDRLEQYDLWVEARRVVALARAAGVV